MRTTNWMESDVLQRKITRSHREKISPKLKVIKHFRPCLVTHFELIVFAEASLSSSRREALSRGDLSRAEGAEKSVFLGSDFRDLRSSRNLRNY